MSLARTSLEPTLRQARCLRGELDKLSWKELRRRAEARRMIGELKEVKCCLKGKGEIPGPLYWLQHHTETFDEKWKEKSLPSPYRKFPDLPYLPWLFEHFLRDRRLFVPKSREMMASWSVVGYAVWTCRFFPRQRVIVQSQKEQKVADLMVGGPDLRIICSVLA